MSAESTPGHAGVPDARGRASTPATRWVRVLLGLVLAVCAVLAVVPQGTARAAEPPECAPLPTFSSHVPYTKDAASMMAVNEVLDPTGERTEVWDRAKGRPDPQYTLYEAMGMSGATWSQSKIVQQEGFKDFEPKTEYACAYLPPALNMVANSIFDLSKIVAAGAISFRSLAAHPTLVVNLLDGAVEPVNRISTGLFLAMSTVMVMLTGLLIVFTGGMRGIGKQRETVRALVGVGVFMLIGTFLVIPSTQGGNSKPNYYWITTSALETIDSANSALSSTLLPNQASDWCSTDSGDARRSFDCLIYQNVIFEPWASGQFGTDLSQPMPYNTDEVARFKESADKLIPPENREQSDLRLIQLWAQGRTLTEQVYGEERAPSNQNDSVVADPESRQGQWNIVREVMWTDFHNQYPTWQGANSGERVNLAFFSMLLSLLVGAFLVVTSGLLLLWNCVLVALFFFLPIIALLGLFPPTQRVFRMWLMTWFKAMVLSFVFQLGQTIAMLMVTAALKLPATGMGMKAVLILMLLLGLWKIVEFARNDMAGQAESRPSGEGQQRNVNSITQTISGIPALAGVSGAVGGAVSAVTGRTVAGSAGRAPGVTRNPVTSSSLNAPGRRRVEGKVSAALADAEQKWLTEHGTPMDERQRTRVREELVRTHAGEAESGAATPGGRRRAGVRSSALGASVRERAEALRSRAESARTEEAPEKPQPPVQHNVTNYNYFRSSPGAASAAEGAARQEAARGQSNLQRGLPRPDRAMAPHGDSRVSGARDKANESRAMESAFRRSLPEGANAQQIAIGRFESFRSQLQAAEAEFGRARDDRDRANREYQLVSGRAEQGLASQAEVNLARGVARQASTALEQAGNRVQVRAQIVSEAERKANDYR